MIKNRKVIAAVLTLIFMGCSLNPGHQYSKARIIQTSKAGDQLRDMGTSELADMDPVQKSFISIDSSKKYQKIVGFGGSFTESSAYLLNQISNEKRNEILNAYFSPQGAHYSLTRTHINSCDFSLKNYAYAMVPGDTLLENFSVQEDEDDLIPLIRDAMAVDNADFKIVASPWTAPPWMKENNDWNDGRLKPEYYPAWALYFSKYIQAYRGKGIPIWAVTVENEPLGNGGQWESMIFSPEEMAAFVKNHLGPQFKNDDLNTNILIYDQNRDHLKEWAEILADEQAAKYIWGTAVHWYSSTYEWYPDDLNDVHNRFPDKHLLHTEGCIDAEVPVWKDDDWYWSKEATDWGYDWAPEQDKYLHPKYVPVYRYARDIIGGLNSWLTGWIDWNIVLDDKGGPNHANNWCIAPVIVKPDSNQVYYTPLYYTLSHFSRYIRPDAVRIGVETDLSDLMITACMNSNKEIVIAVLNQTASEYNFSINVNNKIVEAAIPGEALQTIIIN